TVRACSARSSHRCRRWRTGSATRPRRAEQEQEEQRKAVFASSSFGMVARIAFDLRTRVTHNRPNQKNESRGKETMATKKASGSKGGGKGLAAEVQPSADLAPITGSKPIPRSEVTKKVWDYVKAHGLQ